MVMELPVDLVPELAPLSWLIDSWEGQGRLGQGTESDEIFYQRVDFTEYGLPFLEYRAESWLCEADATLIRPLTIETGFWSLARERHDADVGPGMKPADVVPAYRSADDVESLRFSEDEFPITATITHPGSLSELYYGVVRGPQISLRAETVMRGELTGQYHSAERILGLVNGQLFWRWDVKETASSPAQPHASASLDRMKSLTDGRLAPGTVHTPGKHDLS
ncbi:FABP family protein [Auritidibacter ignavus]|uniref:FABP family protein n=1 Tax=Auritidibacter ignavus TaxID=678932 RepID=UPI0024BAF8D4|nr:FABP family protein [Auritidibacter ignavus]WHS28549.1 FABP family protein [Auritidibacter ignavus]